MCSAKFTNTILLVISVAIRKRILLVREQCTSVQIARLFINFKLTFRLPAFIQSKQICFSNNSFCINYPHLVKLEFSCMRLMKRLFLSNKLCLMRHFSNRKQEHFNVFIFINYLYADAFISRKWFLTHDGWQEPGQLGMLSERPPGSSCRVDEVLRWLGKRKESTAEVRFIHF